MTGEDIIRMAEECGIPEFENNESQADNIIRFAALVYAEAHQHGLDDFEATVLPVAIAAEREACAKVADENAAYWAGYKIAAAIRARGQA